MGPHNPEHPEQTGYLKVVHSFWGGGGRGQECTQHAWPMSQGLIPGGPGIRHRLLAGAAGCSMLQARAGVAAFMGGHDPWTVTSWPGGISIGASSISVLPRTRTLSCGFDSRLASLIKPAYMLNYLVIIRVLGGKFNWAVTWTW